jgi:membrane protein implicated in regulation of membrane protease activity
MLRTILLVTRGILLDPRTRRWAMFVLLLAALLMLFAGSTFLAGSLATPLNFLVYWGICGWLTFAALLLALWDLLVLRIAARRERRRLEKQMLDHPPDDKV